MTDEYKALFSLVDQVSGPIAAMAARVQASNLAIEASAARMSAAFAPLRDVRAGIGLLGAELARLSSNAGVPRLGDAFATLGNRMRSVGGHVAGFIGPLAALGALGTAGGLAATIRSAVNEAGELNDLWARLGARTDRQRGLLADFNYSARQTSATSEDVRAALVRLNRAAALAASGADHNLVDLFRRLRIPLRAANGEIRAGIDLLPEFSRALRRNENASLRTRAAMAILGKKGEALIPALLELKKNTARRERFSGVWSQQDVENLDDVGDAFTDLSIAVQGVGKAIAARLAPALTPLVESLAAFVARNRELIATHVGAFWNDMAAKLRAVDWASAWQGVRQVSASIAHVVDSIGGWKVALGGLAAVMAGPFLLAVTSAGTALVALGTALLTTPIGLAATAIGGAGYLIWRNWESIAGVFRSVGAAVAGVAERFAGHYGPQFAAFRDNILGLGERLLNPIRAAWQSFASFFEGVVERIMRLAAPVLDALANLNGGRTTAPAESTRGPGERRRGTLGGAQRIEELGEPANDAGARQRTLGQGGSLGLARVLVEFANAPSGLRASAMASGPALGTPELAVGYAMGGR